MNIGQIEKNLKELTASFSKEIFIYGLLLAYGLPKASITRLKKGNLNLSKAAGEISWKKKLFFKEEYAEDLHLTVLSLKAELKQDQRFVVVTDYKTLLAIDTKTNEKLDISLMDLPKHYDFFLPWAGMEKAQHQNENPADVKAAVNMANLFDAIKKDNPSDSPEFIHGLNVFLSRLLFCFFAEDTHIFEDNQFTNALDSHTQTDGSDLHRYLDTLFDVMNTPKDQREDLPVYLDAFPYVNGGLFQDTFPAPNFTRASRATLLSSGDQDWSAINPDIFGSMFQAVISNDQRGSLGQHYTSVPNIMKVIEPLFLNDLYAAFEKAKGSRKQLNALLVRLEHIKIFDPACGSGNFLIIAYKELRKLEMAIIKEAAILNLPRIHLSNFYGIEIDDFAHEIAKLALWLAEHQMNVEFLNEFGRTNPTLPLQDAGQIICGNATRLDWEEVCPKTKEGEVYILGNPPYLGGRMQGLGQKEDLRLAYKPYGKPKKVDYITCWFFKASEYIKDSKSRYAFVTTNSICQGEQVSMVWGHILNSCLEIAFAYTSFKWVNNAKGNAGVTVSIIGVRNIHKDSKYIFTSGVKSKVKNINPYLYNSANIFITKRSLPLSIQFKMEYGNMAIDGGFLILSYKERNQLINNYDFAIEVIKQIYGAQEFLNGVERYCLWISDDQLEKAKIIPEIAERISLVKEKRLEGNDKGSINLAKRPHQFREMKRGLQSALIVPTVSSERRTYIPVGYLSADSVVIAPNQVIYDSDPYIMGIISSKMHMAWVKTVAGRLKTDYRYSSTLVYNTFPFPPISTQRKNEITQNVFRILEEREKHSDKTLAQLYDPDKMPEGLREAHHQNDLAIERCYRSKPFASDAERLAYLFKLYEKMIAAESKA